MDQLLNAQTSFDSLCQQLEFHLTELFSNSSDNVLKYWWCDGVDSPALNEQFTNKNISNIKQVITKAWIGPNGSDRFNLIILLGNRSIKRSLKGQNLDDCLPDTDSLDWVEIDTNSQNIVLQIY